MKGHRQGALRADKATENANKNQCQKETDCSVKSLPVMQAEKPQYRPPAPTEKVHAIPVLGREREADAQSQLAGQSNFINQF